MPPTPRHGLVTLTGGEGINTYPAAFTDAMTDIDSIMAVALTGTRPAAGISGRFHYDGATGALTFDTGLAWIGVSRVPPFVETSLPAATYDGFEIFYAAGNNRTWHLRWRSSNPAPYKWDFVGGPPIISTRGGSLAATGSTGYRAAASVVAPLAGLYHARAEASIYSTAEGYEHYVSPDGTDANAAMSTSVNTAGGAAAFDHLAAEAVITLTANGSTASCHTRSTIGANGSTGTRGGLITLTPVRLADVP